MSFGFRGLMRVFVGGCHEGNTVLNQLGSYPVKIDCMWRWCVVLECNINRHRGLFRRYLLCTGLVCLRRQRTSWEIICYRKAVVKWAKDLWCVLWSPDKTEPKARWLHCTVALKFDLQKHIILNLLSLLKLTTLCVTSCFTKHWGTFAQ
jgi:hypothetical protein